MNLPVTGEQSYNEKLSRLRALAKWLKTEYRLEWVVEYNRLKQELRQMNKQLAKHA